MVQSNRIGKFWIIDRLSSDRKDLFKIGFGNNHSSYVVVCSPGDYLFFASGQWQRGELTFAKGRPLAKILSTDASGITVGVWDETGFVFQKKTIRPIEIAAYPFVKPESLFSSLKQRNNSEISCIMGKRRVVLKTGSWWIKSLRGWHRLKNRQEVEDYQAYRLLGELIVVDELESFQGRTVLKGRLIDPLRLHIEPFSLQVAESKARTNKTSYSNSPHANDKIQTPTDKVALKPQPLLKATP